MEIIFSPDSERVAYIAKKGRNLLLILDGDVLEERKFIGTPYFSQNGEHFAYSIEQDNKFSFVIDGREGRKYTKVDFVIIFSPDSQHFAYRAMKEDKQLVVIDDAETTIYDGIGENSLTFSPNSKKFAYSAREGKKWFYIVDGEKCNEYEMLSSAGITFSPDSTHFAYAARNKGKGFIVLDEKEGWHYDDIVNIKPMFSDDSNHIAYWAAHNDYSINNRAKLSAPPDSVSVIVDDREGICCTNAGDIIFAPNSNEVFYQSGAYDFWNINYFDGLQEIKDQIGTNSAFNSIDSMIFAPDGKRLLCVVLVHNAGGKLVHLIDGIKKTPDQEMINALNEIPGQVYTDILSVQNKKIIFKTSDVFEYVVYSKSDKMFYLIKETME